MMGLSGFSLADQIIEMFLRLIGFETVENVNEEEFVGTAIDQITKLSNIGSEILLRPEVREIYDVCYGLTIPLFILMVHVWAICYIANEMGHDNYEKYATSTVFLKASFICMLMIHCGPWILSFAMDLNTYLSSSFASTEDMTMLMSQSVSSDLGCLLIVFSCMWIAYMGIFYIIRFIILLASIGAWVWAWIFYAMGQGNSSTSSFFGAMSFFIILLIFSNIFMGSAISFVFWLGIKITTVIGSYGYLVGWGGYFIGICIMIVAGCVPLVAFILVLYLMLGRTIMGSIRGLVRIVI